jgi:hypothetical protein
LIRTLSAGGSTSPFSDSSSTNSNDTNPSLLGVFAPRSHSFRENPLVNSLSSCMNELLKEFLKSVNFLFGVGIYFVNQVFSTIIFNNILELQIGSRSEAALRIRCESFFGIGIIFIEQANLLFISWQLY